MYLMKVIFRKENNMKKNILCLLLIFLLPLVISGCSNKVTITYMIDNKVVYTTQQKVGEELEEFTYFTKEYFYGCSQWMVNESDKTIFEGELTTDLTLYGSLTENIIMSNTFSFKIIYLDLESNATVILPKKINGQDIKTFDMKFFSNPVEYPNNSKDKNLKIYVPKGFLWDSYLEISIDKNITEIYFEDSRENLNDFFELIRPNSVKFHYNVEVEHLNFVTKGNVFH